MAQLLNGPMANNAMCFQPVLLPAPVSGNEAMQMPLQGMQPVRGDNAAFMIGMFPAMAAAQQMGFPTMLPDKSQMQLFDPKPRPPSPETCNPRNANGMRAHMRSKQNGMAANQSDGALRPEELEDLRRAVKETRQACMMSRNRVMNGSDMQSGAKVEGRPLQHGGLPDGQNSSQASTCSSREVLPDPALLGFAEVDAKNYHSNRGLVLSTAWHLAVTERGCRIVQKALEVGTTEEQQLIASKLHGHVREALMSPHANYVLQKCVEVLPPEEVQFVVAELQGHAVEFAKHQFGCRIFQRLIEHCPLQQTEALIVELLDDCANLCRDQYGNFVIQHVLKYGSVQHRAVIAKVLCADAPRFAKHRIASHVIASALAQCDPDDVRVMSSKLLADGELADQSGRRYGKFVMRELQRAICQLDAMMGA